MSPVLPLDRLVFRLLAVSETGGNGVDDGVEVGMLEEGHGDPVGDRLVLLGVAHPVPRRYPVTVRPVGEHVAEVDDVRSGDGRHP
jgi:hypothetical protein